MIPFAPVLAACGPEEIALGAVAVIAVFLLGLFLVMKKKLSASLVEKTRTEFSEELLAKFRRGMESRIGGGGVTSGADASEGMDRILAYANIAEALSGGYECVYYIDLATNHFDQYRSQGLYEHLKVEKAGEDFFGITQSLLPSTMHPDDLPRMQEAFRKEAMLAATEGGRVFSITYRLNIRGEYFWYNFRALRPSGDTGHLVGAISNVDEQMKREKGHEARADESVAKLEEMLAQSSRSRATLVKLATYQDADELRDVALRETGQALGAVAVYLYRHKMDGTSPLVHAWFRTPDYNVLPKNAAELIGSPDYLDEHPDIRYVLGQEEGNQPLWDDFLRKSRAQRFLAGTLRVDGEVWGHVGYLVDRPGTPGREELELFHEACALVQIGVLRAKIIETRDTHQRQLVASARAANQAARAKTMFLATMSHEIRTPLNAVIGFSEFLNRPEVTPEEIKEYTAGISHSANALLALINDILDLSKLEAGRVDMNGRCDLVKLFDEMDSLFHYRAVTKDLRLEHTIRKDFPVLKLSEEHVRQILLNLIGNAVKFTDAGLVEWTAEAHADGADTVSLNINITDTGIGISKDKLKTIFDPFVQDGATRGGKVYSGTGLGLPIVKRLLEACNGTIEMESAPGEGTRVHIHIDRVPVLPKNELPAPGPASAGTAALKLPASFRAVIVDDVPINLKILDLHVKGLGISDIARAASAEEALKAIAEKKPDVVLTDMWMPGMSGADLAAEIRKDHSLDDVPLVAVTADNDVGATFDASLFAEILTKPVTADKLKLAMMHLFPNAR